VHGILTFFKRLAGYGLQSLHHRYIAWTKPAAPPLLLDTLTDFARSKSELVAENALLRQQLIILKRQVKLPACTNTDRMLLVLLASMVRTWKQVLFIVQPETLVRLHSQGFKLYWRYKSRAISPTSKISAETIELIKKMARDNRLWGAERIRGELLKLGVTRSPTDAWTAQQLREATPYGQGPKYLIRDRDGKFGSCFARAAATSGIKILKTPYHAPRANAICERFVGSVRRECLDHLFIFHEKQLHRVLRAYIQYFNQARPHQGIRQQIPEQYGEPGPADREGGKILSLPVLGGLHHDYRRSA
jgi:Integrase core domain